MNLSEKLINLYEMANLRPDETNLPMVIYVQPKTDKEQHGPRIKVQKEHGEKVKKEMVSIGFTREGKVSNFNGLAESDFKLVTEFINNNLKGLLDLWDDKISPTEFSKTIIKNGK